MNPSRLRTIPIRKSRFIFVTDTILTMSVRDQILALYPQTKRYVAIIGSVNYMFCNNKEMEMKLARELGEKLSTLENTVILTGGNPASGLILCEYTTLPVFHLLSRDMELSMSVNHVIQTGVSMADRREILATTATHVISFGGGPGTMDELSIAYKHYKVLIPLPFTGGKTEEFFHQFKPPMLGLEMILKGYDDIPSVVNGVMLQFADVNVKQQRLQIPAELSILRSSLPDIVSLATYLLTVEPVTWDNATIPIDAGVNVMNRIQPILNKAVTFVPQLEALLLQHRTPGDIADINQEISQYKSSLRQEIRLLLEVLNDLIVACNLYALAQEKTSLAQHTRDSIRSLKLFSNEILQKNSSLFS